MREDRRLANAVIGFSIFCILLAIMQPLGIKDEVLNFLGCMLLLIVCAHIPSLSSDKYP